MDELKKMRDALAKIAQVVNQAIDYNGSNQGGSGEEQKPEKTQHDAEISCSIKVLPARLRRKSAEHAVSINPVNAPVIGAVSEEISISDPMSLTLLTSKYWGPLPRRLTVSFMEATAPVLRARIVAHMNAWTRSECISFVETAGVGNVRISRGAGGYWSYLGTDILLIPANRPTMNLQGFSMNTSEAEYKRVVRHETGHTLGFPHEHMRRELVARIDPAKAYPYFLRTQGWNKAMVDAQVLTPLSDFSILGTPADQTSIMCYQLPGSITRDGLPITGGVDINATDFAFAGRIYPKLGFAMSPEQISSKEPEEEWADTEDVDSDELQKIIQKTLEVTNGNLATA